MALSTREVAPMPEGVTEWYSTVQGFLGTLHEIMQTGAANAETADAQAAEKIRTFEYNWLSLIGYYRGITPLLYDFYFHYLDNAEFSKKNGPFIRTMNGLVGTFTRPSDPEKVYKLLGALVGMREELFNDGAIRSLLSDLKEIVDNKPACMKLIEQAQLNAGDIAKFLDFLMHGAKRQKAKRNINAEL
jgi:hypothetical protein